ncbi:MAG TPA: DUF2065 domain-containing protein [Solimonas sp.]
MSPDASELLRAVALVMVIEGLMPFAAPSRWRGMLLTVASLSDRSLRLLGFASLAAGVVVLQLA